MATDKLVRKFYKISNDIDEIHKENIDDFIENQFNCLRVCSIQANEKEKKQFLKNEYSEKL